MNDDELSSSITSMCMALVERHVNNRAQRLLLAWPPLVLRVTTDHGPNVSIPTDEKGGLGDTLSSGKSDISYCSCFPLNLRQMTHLYSNDEINLISPTIQKPASLNAPAVKWRIGALLHSDNGGSTELQCGCFLE